MTTTMRAMVFTAANQPLEEQVLTRPTPGPKQVLVRIHASGINPLDTKIAAGAAAHARVTAPAILGLDMAGEVVAVGPGVADFAVGDEVYGMVGGVGELSGTLAEFVVADASLLAPKPNTMTMAEAAALPLVGITAWEGVVDRADVRPDDTVLVIAAGGVGQAAMQIAAARGAQVYAAVRPARLEAVTASGATAIDIESDPPQAWVEKHTQAQGFDIVYDTIGGAGLDLAFEAVKPYTGHVVSCLGWGQHPLAPLSFRNATYSGVFTLAPLLTGLRREHFSSILRELGALVDDGRLRPPSLHGDTMAMTDVNHAYELVAEGNTTGKIVLQGW